jgi:hypothetical protein
MALVVLVAERGNLRVGARLLACRAWACSVHVRRERQESTASGDQKTESSARNHRPHGLQVRLPSAATNTFQCALDRKPGFSRTPSRKAASPPHWSNRWRSTSRRCTSCAARPVCTRRATAALKALRSSSLAESCAARCFQHQRPSGAAALTHTAGSAAITSFVRIGASAQPCATQKGLGVPMVPPRAARAAAAAAAALIVSENGAGCLRGVHLPLERAARRAGARPNTTAEKHRGKATKARVRCQPAHSSLRRVEVGSSLGGSALACSRRGRFGLRCLPVSGNTSRNVYLGCVSQAVVRRCLM